MTTSFTCPVCGSRDILTNNETGKFVFRSGGVDYPVTATYPVHECRSCGEAFVGDAAETARHEATCVAMNRLTPAEIVALRSKLGLTRKAFAELSGFGEASLARWETGELIQSESNDNLLRLLMTDANVRQLHAIRALAGGRASSALTDDAGVEGVEDSALAVSVAYEKYLGLDRAAVDQARAQGRNFRITGMAA